jgi:ATP phosphoribosyltransferase regulatory subunit
LAPALSVDLGEVRDFAYYTGVTFQVLATGPGEPVGSGGRYDRLLEKFGAPRSAAGFAVALDHLNWALGRVSAATRFRALISAKGVDPGPVLGRLRAAGIACAAFSGADPLVYARAWRYACVIELDPSGATLHELEAINRESEILALLEAKSVSMGQP